jgi:hypothetical protein
VPEGEWNPQGAFSENYLKKQRNLTSEHEAFLRFEFLGERLH